MRGGILTGMFLSPGQQHAVPLQLSSRLSFLYSVALRSCAFPASSPALGYRCTSLASPPRLACSQCCSLTLAAARRWLLPPLLPFSLLDRRRALPAGPYTGCNLRPGVASAQLSEQCSQVTEVLAGLQRMLRPGQVAAAFAISSSIGCWLGLVAHH